MSKEEVIELLESLKGDTSGNMQSIPETVYESIFNERIDEVIKKIKPKKISKEELSKVIQIGYDVWNGEYQKLIGWLNTSCPAMGGKKPIEYSKQEIIDEMMRIEYGIYS
tara:strand:- start:45 stop:374 length:330 start_codon:yes stop_codon:yes gene_type:complete